MKMEYYSAKKDGSPVAYRDTRKSGDPCVKWDKLVKEDTYTA